LLRCSVSDNVVGGHACARAWCSMTFFLLFYTVSLLKQGTWLLPKHLMFQIFRFSEAYLKAGWKNCFGVEEVSTKGLVEIMHVCGREKKSKKWALFDFFLLSFFFLFSFPFLKNGVEKRAYWAMGWLMLGSELVAFSVAVDIQDGFRLK